jgi:hypothetical protein
MQNGEEETSTMCRQPWVLLAVVCLIALPATARARADNLTEDLAVLRTVGVDTDGAGLIAFFKKRTLSEVTRKKIADHIRLLGDEDFAIREKATTDLIDIGAVARPLLAQALRNRDLEVSRRARRALDTIGTAAAETNLLPAAARVLANRKPAGAAEVLLNFLPNIEEVDTAEEVARVVGLVAIGKDGKPEAAVLLALSDKHWIKRYAAAEALSRIAVHRAAVRKLLKDDDTGLRRRVALALLQAHDKEAVPALIGLLTATASEDAGAAEEMLIALAGDKSPARPEEDTAEARERYRRSWEAWWKEAGGKIDLAKVDFEGVGRGHTLIATLDVGTTGKVQELDNAGKVRWTIGDLRYPIFASLSRRDRVLICEYSGNRVTERDFKGNVLWEKRVAVSQLQSARRLRNGNIFISARNLLVEVDRSGKEVKSMTRPFDVLSAERHDDGTTSIVTTGGQCIQLDSAGRQTNSFNVGLVSTTIGTRCCFLPKGGVIIPDYLRSKVREYDASGKMIWEADVMRPNSVTRLPNGHTLVGSRLRNRIVELDKTGREVSGQTVTGRPIFVDRR